jgi:hypothetical protein
VTERYDTKLWGGFSLEMRYRQVEERTHLSPESFEGEWEEDFDVTDTYEAIETLLTWRYSKEQVRQAIIERGEWL